MEVTGIRFRHRGGADEVLKGVDLWAREGEITILLGPNGSGKSTLFKCILGIWRAQEGRIRVDGRDVSALPFSERAKIFGYVPQDHDPPFPYRVLDFVLMGRAPYLGLFSSPGPRDYQKAEEALEALGIAPLRDKPYTRISGGERQLVLLARVLAQDTPYLLLDEPTSHLDFKNQVTVLSKARELSRHRGRCTLITLHDPNLASLFGDRILLMKDGRLIAQGNPEEVLTDEVIEEVYGIPVSAVKVDGRRIILPLDPLRSSL